MSELDDLVTAADIGRRLGLTRQRAAQLAGEPGFPSPLGRVGNYVVYRWRDVEKWARKTGRKTSDETPLQQLGLPTRALHPLLRVGFETAGDVVTAGRGALERIPNYTRSSIAEVVQALAARGLDLRD